MIAVRRTMRATVSGCHEPPRGRHNTARRQLHRNISDRHAGGGEFPNYGFYLAGLPVRARLRETGSAGSALCHKQTHALRGKERTYSITSSARSRIDVVSRHRSVDTLQGYVRDAEMFRDHAGTGLL